MPDATLPTSTIPDYDRDSIHTLRLSVLPISNGALARAKLIKNHRLETRVELFRDGCGGSGQIAIDQVPDFFPGESEGLQRDIELLHRVGELPAFDPYSLRVGLRQAGIDPLDLDALRLSAAKQAELRPLMRGIARPLAVHLFGDGARGDDLERMMRKLDGSTTPLVRQRILSMAAALRVGIDAVPDMLEDYADTYLALSYYRGYLLYALPVADRIIRWMRDVSATSFLQSDANTRRVFQRVEGLLTLLVNSATARFNGFDRQKVLNWDAVTLDTFRATRRMVTEHQQSLAQVLCGLTVKIYEWEQRFPNAGGSPEKRADFVAADLAPGLEMLWTVERAAARFKGDRNAA